MTRQEIEAQIALLKEIVSNPKRVQTDSGTVEQHDIDPVKALKQLQALQAQLDAIDSPTGRVRVQIGMHND